MKQWIEADVRRFGAEVADLIADYFAALDTVPITPREPGGLAGMFDGPLPEQGEDPFSLLAEVRQKVLPNSFHLGSPGYFGLFNPTPTIIGVFADAIASTINQNMAAWSHGPAGAQIEKTVIRWMCDLIGYPRGAFGTLTSGGSLANYTGLKISLNEKVPEVRRIGVAAAEGRPTFYVSTQAHYSIDRLADLLGIGTDGMRKIDCDAEARVIPEALERQILADLSMGRLPFCVVGIAGTTTSGAIDPLGALADICQRHRLWFHVDAAWGGAARLASGRAMLLDGIERADSVTLDPHKWFSVPFCAGAIVVKDGEALRRTFEVKPHYVTDRVFTEHEDLNWFQFGVAGSRRFDALKVWLSLRQHGRRGYEEAVERQIALAEYLHARLSESEDFEAMSRPSLGVLCFRYVPAHLKGRDAELDALQMTIQDEVQRRGTSWISTSILGGRRVFRFCVTSYLSRERHVDAMLEQVRQAAPRA
ncbi:MAG TPA: pyridoxal-dependent decarboxylase [Patescibacteria group bacterium]|nr:pyridoxal-dependent decarboxylase [Patescibacteria group bacterium]